MVFAPVIEDGEVASTLFYKESEKDYQNGSTHLYRKNPLTPVLNGERDVSFLKKILFSSREWIHGQEIAAWDGSQSRNREAERECYKMDNLERKKKAAEI